MLNKWIKAAFGVALVVGLAAPAGAMTGYNAANTPQKITYVGINTALPGFWYTLPALAQNAIDTLTVPVAQVLKVYAGNSNAPTVATVTGYASTVAGDSLNVSIDVSVDPSGSWLNAVNFANAFSHTASLGARYNATAATTLIPAPFWRLRVKSKGTAALIAGKRFFVYFPVVSSAIPPK